ncbi:hypothetical protein RIF29_41829 [Crotalaria pallida]|uniref:Cytochrome P450 n=1 Tax=Crotalaria pallida TaxID=3830 RepID=A0AAN9E740_CROPI
MDLLHYDNNNNNAKDSDKCQSHHNKHIKEIICGIVEEMARPNVSDIFPFLRVFDIQGAQARMTNHHAKLFAFFDGVIEGRMLLRTSDSKKFNDVLDSLIDLIEEESSQLSRHDIIHLFGDMFIGGLDTTSTILEWAMAELLHNPTKLVKVREELQHKLVNFGEIVEESHASSKFPYLCAILKETLRLHPPAPFLLPHKSNDDIELAGFMIPKGAQVGVNVWSIGRDSSIWTNPDLFEPERFLECDIDFKGKGGFELIPFGAGRRICPGLPLASRFMHFILASLLHHFDWKLPDDDLNQQDMNMDHKFEFTLRKAKSLCVIHIKV